MVPLERRNMPWALHAVQVKAAPPFVEAISGRYTHRVRSAALHTICGKTHMSVQCWCGMHINVSVKRPNRLTDEPSGRPICATCEGRAIGAGQLGAREIAGREVLYQPKGRDVR